VTLAESYWKGRLNFDASMSLSAIQTVATGADIVNLALNSRVFWLQVTPSAAIDFTGMVAPVSALQNQLVLVTNNAARTTGRYMRCINNGVSTLVNRLMLRSATPTFIMPGQSQLFQYDLNTEDGARWRQLDFGAPTSITLSVNVPVIAVAGQLAYQDTSLAGTPFANVASATPVVVNPQADLAAAGAGAGYMLPGRISIAGNLRIPFVGTLAGGATNFTVALPGV
jgi:hypothetical protein